MVYIFSFIQFTVRVNSTEEWFISVHRHAQSKNNHDRRSATVDPLRVKSTPLLPDTTYLIIVQRKSLSFSIIFKCLKSLLGKKILFRKGKLSWITTYSGTPYFVNPCLLRGPLILYDFRNKGNILCIQDSESENFKK